MIHFLFGFVNTLNIFFFFVLWQLHCKKVRETDDKHNKNYIKGWKIDNKLNRLAAVIKLVSLGSNAQPGLGCLNDDAMGVWMGEAWFSEMWTCNENKWGSPWWDSVKEELGKVAEETTSNTDQ